MLFFSLIYFSLISMPQGETGAGPQRPMSEMHGDCGAYALDMSREWALWDQQSVPLRAGLGKGALPDGKLGQKLGLRLHALDQLQLAVTLPDGKQPKPGSYGGLLGVRVTRDGFYRFSLDSRLWIELAGADGQALPTQLFEMQTGCDRIFKVVVFSLKAGTDYVLQLTAAATEATYLLITPHQP